MKAGSSPPSPRVVLTADRILMGDYPVLFDGVAAAVQTTSIPGFLMKALMSPRLPSRGGRLLRAPLGLRRLEAVLLAGGFAPGEVALAAPEDLGRVIGPETRVVGLSGGDFLGLGMNDATVSFITGGRTWNEKWTGAVCRRLARLRRRHPFTLVAGGPGAWQLAGDRAAARRLGIDTIYTGYAENGAAALFRRLARGEKAPALAGGGEAPPGSVPPVAGPVSMGVVEVTRGCGWGCRFCTMGETPMFDLPRETILADARASLDGGVTSLVLTSEDILRYGAEGERLRPEKLLDLVAELRRDGRLRIIQLDHVNVSSVLATPLDTLKRIKEAITAGRDHRFLWVNLGVETASAELLRRCGGAAKMRGLAPEWPAACREAVVRLEEAGFLPMVSLVLGLPGEEPGDVEQTLAWAEGVAHRRLTLVPLFLGGTPGEGRAFTGADLTPAHWRLVRLGYALNFRWGARLYRDNLRAAGAPWRRRALVALGLPLHRLLWRWYLRRGRVR